MAWEVLTSCLVASLIDVWDLLSDTFCLVTYIRVHITILLL